LETSIEELLKSEGYYIHQEVKDGGSGSGFHSSFGSENVYHQGIEKETLKMLLDAKNSEIQSLREEVRFLKEKVDQLVEVIEKKG
jgi:hypothetical protein